MKTLNNPKLKADRWCLVRGTRIAWPELVGANVLVLGQLPFAIRPLVESGARVTKVSLVTDLAVEVVVEKHHPQGWEILSTFFGQDALPDVKWDFVVMQGSETAAGLVCQSAFEIVKMGNLAIKSAQVVVVLGYSLRSQPPSQLPHLAMESGVGFSWPMTPHAVGGNLVAA